MTASADVASAGVDTRPECPFCHKGRLTTLIFLIICVYCQKAWKPYEFEIDLRRLDAEELES